MQQTNQDCADMTVATIWGREAKRAFRNDFSQMVPSTLTYLRTVTAGYLNMEGQRIRNSVQHLDQLLMRAFANEAHSLFNNPGNQKDPQTYYALDTDSDVTRAAKWICKASNSMDENSTAILISVQRCIDTVLNRDLDLRDVATLERIHKGVVGSLPANMDILRPTPIGQNYTGVAGGTYLQEYASRQSRRLRTTIALPPHLAGENHRVRTPGQQQFVFVPQRMPNYNNNWANIGCYLHGAYIRAHGFADGNGRSVRTLFACTLIKSGMGFVAPSRAFETSLCGL
ncbi:Fic family protein [Roseibium aggregatum]|uniref:Fic family protein n=1 Tax=Roseibium aggregatum TaxID=187304 RepID=A0A939E8M7_9HYPH|nr:Fic family protein [Roseibium aggregatum]MBN9668896.1 Fic family protein [Roseibium aggregatum]